MTLIAPPPRFSACRCRACATMMPAHELRGHGKEVGAVLPLWMVFIGELEVGVVEQSRGLESVARSFPFHALMRDALKLGLDERDEPFQGARIAAAPLKEELRDLLLGQRRCHHIRQPPWLNNNRRETPADSAASPHAAKAEEVFSGDGRLRNPICTYSGEPL